MPRSRFYQARVFQSAVTKTAQQRDTGARASGLVKPQENCSKSEDDDSKEAIRAEKVCQVRGAAPIASVGSSAGGKMSSVENLPRHLGTAGKDTAESRTNTNTSLTTAAPPPQETDITAARYNLQRGGSVEKNSDQQGKRDGPALSTQPAQQTDTGAQRPHQHQDQPRKRGSKKRRPKSQYRQQQRDHENKQHARTPIATTAVAKPPSDVGSSPSGVTRASGCHGELENDEDRTGQSSDLKRLEFHELSPSTSTDCEEGSPLPKANKSRQGDSIDSLCSSLLEILAEADECGKDERVIKDRGVVSQAESVVSAVASAPNSATSADGKAKQQQQQQQEHQKRRDKQKAHKKRNEASATLPARQQPNDGKKKTSDDKDNLLMETVDVAGEAAQWAADNSRGGEFTKMLETVKRDSGAVSMDTRVVLGKGTGQGGRAHM